jgi:hypothetical protein
LVTGAVFRTLVTDTTPPKIKMFVIVAEAGDDVAVVYINSKPRLHAATSNLQALQLALTVKDCPFLDHDSFVDCSELCVKSKALLEKLVKNDGKVFKAFLPPSITKDILAIIRRAKTTSLEHRQKFGLTY